jgi:hypothetical protein
MTYPEDSFAVGTIVGRVTDEHHGFLARRGDGLQGFVKFVRASVYIGHDVDSFR